MFMWHAARHRRWGICLKVHMQSFCYFWRNITRMTTRLPISECVIINRSIILLMIDWFIRCSHPQKLIRKLFNNFTIQFFVEMTFNDKRALFGIKTHCAVFRTRTCKYDDCDKWTKNETCVTIVGLSVRSFHVFYSFTMLFLLFARFLHFWLHDL